MRYFIEAPNESISGDNPKSIDLEQAWLKLEELFVSQGQGVFIGFVNENNQTLQFMAKAKEKWLLDRPVIKNGQYIKSEQKSVDLIQMKAETEKFFQADSVIVQADSTDSDQVLSSREYDRLTSKPDNSLKIILIFSLICLVGFSTCAGLAYYFFNQNQAKYDSDLESAWQRLVDFSQDLVDYEDESNFRQESNQSGLGQIKYLDDISAYQQLVADGDYSGAVEMIIASDLSIDRQVDYLAELAGYLAGNGLYSEAVVTAEKMVELSPDYYSYNYLGWVYLDQEKYTKAIEYFKLAVEDNPGYRPAFNNLGICYDELENYPKAEEAYLKAIEISPDNPKSYANLSYVYINTGRSDEAIEILKKALALNSVSGELKTNVIADQLYWLGRLYYDRGEYGLCASYLEQSLEYDPDDESGQEYYNACLSQLPD